MTINEFLAKVDEIKALNPKYKLGHDGDDGYCDCVGLIIGAVRRCGEKWTGIHGSNWAVRNYTANLHEVTSAVQLSLGELVYKAREPGDDYYDLPNRYDNHPDRKDYYHIGVVTQVNPLRITHCTSGGGVDGIIVDKKLGKQWKWAGELTLIDRTEDNGSEEETTVVMTATVTAKSGSNVNMRKTPSKTGLLVDRVPVGATVAVNSNNDEWAQIVYNAQTGYMMSEFLALGDEGADAGTGDVSRAEEIRAEIMRLVDELVGMAK